MQLIEYKPLGAADGAGDAADTEKAAQLMGIVGCTAEEAANALAACGGDMDRAADMLTSGGPPPYAPYAPYSAATHFDPKDAAATLWGFDVGSDLKRKEASRKALEELRNNAPAGLVTGSPAWLNALVLAVHHACLAGPGAPQAALFAKAAKDPPSGAESDAVDASNPNLKPADQLAKLALALPRTKRRALSAAPLAESLGASSANPSIADTFTKLIRGLDIPELDALFRVTVADVTAFLVDGAVVFMDTRSTQANPALQFSAGDVIGASCITDAFRKRFGAGAGNANGEADGRFLEDEGAELPGLLLATLDTQFRGFTESRIALDPFCRSQVMEGSGAAAADIARQLEEAEAKRTKLKPHRIKHMRSLLNHLKAVQEKDSIPPLERLISWLETSDAELQSRIEDLKARQQNLFNSSRHIYRLFAVFTDQPSPNVLIDLPDRGWTRFTDDLAVEEPSFAPDSDRTPARAVFYARSSLGGTIDLDPPPPPAWIERWADADDARFSKPPAADVEMAEAEAPAAAVPILVEDEPETVPIVIDEGEKAEEGSDGELPHPSTLAMPRAAKEM
ncbi:hypothetical protein DFJ74DRAFT_764046 [Hyaloraphidium curvatum]|nr:hypothetical protein DFJ74DRAFT_764046 [Hyaloraphidium curvatum]